jgi:hypothetical protein
VTDVELHAAIAASPFHSGDVAMSVREAIAASLSANGAAVTIASSDAAETELVLLCDVAHGNRYTGAVVKGARSYGWTVRLV